MLSQSKPLTNGPVSEDTSGEEVIPLHLVMVGINVVGPVVTYALVYVRNIQFPVGVNHNILEDF